MPLRHEPDVANANWFTQSGDPWAQLSSIGPSGFARYARVFHSVQPGADESDRDSLINLEGHLDHETLQRLVGVLKPHTTTPLDCFFGLWDGFGDIHGSPSVGLLKADSHGLETDRWIPPAFSPVVLNGPRVSIPARDYLLFRGPLRLAGQWGAADLVPGRQRDLNSPNLMWPADHAWFTATEIDLPWTGVAGTAELIEDLLAAAGLDVEVVEPSGKLPYWRSGA